MIKKMSDKLNTMNETSYENIELCIKALDGLIADESHKRNGNMLADEWFTFGSELSKIAIAKYILNSILVTKDLMEGLYGNDTTE